MRPMSALDAAKVGVRRRDGQMQVQALTEISAGEAVLHFVGVELKTPTRHSIQIGIDRHIDAIGTDPAVPANVFRFLNHSCEANARVEKFDLIAVRAISAGEQITFDYDANEWDMRSPFRCACGAVTCRGLVRGFRHLGPAERQRIEPLFSTYLRTMRTR
jgi:hypothetical protein